MTEDNDFGIKEHIVRKKDMFADKDIKPKRPVIRNRTKSKNVLKDFALGNVDEDFLDDLLEE